MQKKNKYVSVLVIFVVLPYSRTFSVSTKYSRVSDENLRYHAYYIDTNYILYYILYILYRYHAYIIYALRAYIITRPDGDPARHF